MVLLRRHTRPVLITSTDALTDSSLHIVSEWSEDPSALHYTLSRAVTTDSADSLDTALIRYMPADTHKPLQSFGFDGDLAMSGNLWHHGADYELCLKGMPEAVLNRSDLTDTERERAGLKLRELAVSGGRVIALASSRPLRPASTLHEIIDSTLLHFDGFIVCDPPVSPRASKAILTLNRQGRAVYLVTGEHQASALALARAAHIAEHHSQVADLRRATAQSALSADVRVFCRARPGQKQWLAAQLRSQYPRITVVDSPEALRQLAG